LRTKILFVALALSLSVAAESTTQQSPFTLVRGQETELASIPAIKMHGIEPVRFEKRDATYFADFGKDAYGNLQITLSPGAPAGIMTVRLGEKLDANGAVERNPPGSVSFREITLLTVTDRTVYRLEIPAKERHKSAAAVHTPASIGEVAPFRYAEIENSPVELNRNNVLQLAAWTAFDDTAASFESDDATLNAVWELCKYTMKMTTAFGVYIDGERERIPYEADAYINQLSHYACDLNPEVARYTVGYLLAHPTWPTEWSLHMPMMAAADYEATGDAVLARRNYGALKKKLLMDKDGVADPKQRQQVGPEVNTVANAFYFHALQKMAALARALKRDDEASDFQGKAGKVSASFNAKLFDEARGVYIDGEGSNHASLHGNMFPLAFGLVPAHRQMSVANFVQSRGMACSVYGAQYLLEALFLSGRHEAALRLLTARGERSWWHMIELGSTATMEAWDAKFKGNLTWNHAWGAAPANIIARYVLGVRPLAPGYAKIFIAPQPGFLKWARGKVPTPHGPVVVDVVNGVRRRVTVDVPSGATACLEFPRQGAANATFDGKVMKVANASLTLTVEGLVPGRHVLETW
jgi:alpha-L-rhamnosidase